LALLCSLLRARAMLDQRVDENWRPDVTSETVLMPPACIAALNESRPFVLAAWSGAPSSARGFARRQP